MRAAEVLGGDIAVGLARGGTRHHEREHVGVGAVLEPRRAVQQRHAPAPRAPPPGAPPAQAPADKHHQHTIKYQKEDKARKTTIRMRFTKTSRYFFNLGTIEVVI